MSKIIARVRRSRLMKCVRPPREPEEEGGGEKAKPFTEVKEEEAKPVAIAAAAVVVKNNQSGLTVRQVFSLKQSWKAVMREEEDFAFDWHMRLFKTNSHLKNLFQGFKDISTDDELRANEALEHHGTMVMTTLDDAITHIDDYDFVHNLLHGKGSSHIKFDGFEPQNFMAMKEPFLDAVKVTLGDRYTENMENIYTIAITYVLQNLVDGITEAQQKAKMSKEEQKQGNDLDASKQQENGTEPLNHEEKQQGNGTEVLKHEEKQHQKEQPEEQPQDADKEKTITDPSDVDKDKTITGPSDVDKEKTTTEPSGVECPPVNQSL